MENIREELKSVLKTNYSLDGGVENIMNVVKKHMIENLNQASDLADKRSDGYGRFSRNMAAMISNIKNL